MTAGFQSKQSFVILLLNTDVAMVTDLEYFEQP